MPDLKDLEIGVMFWAGGDPRTTIQEVKSFGVQCGQLGVPGDLDLTGAAEQWKQAAAAEDFHISTVFCAYRGENYADIPTVQKTVGLIPPETRKERLQRTLEASDFAADVGVKSIATHIGFVPHNPAHPDYKDVCRMVQEICDHAAQHHQTFALETGQEPADVLLKFIEAVGRPNLGINFDPANMIMYGTGDPILALDVLSGKLLSVHCKDGTWPPKGSPSALGVEQPLGCGAVGMQLFLAKLRQIGYRGALNVEREAEDPEQRKADIRMGVQLLEQLRG